MFHEEDIKQRHFRCPVYGYIVDADLSFIYEIWSPLYMKAWYLTSLRKACHLNSGVLRYTSAGNS